VKRRKTWAEKMASAVPHQVKPAPTDIAGMKKGEIMLIPTARMIDDFIRAIPRGKSMDVLSMRLTLAKRHKAQVACPITTGILLRIVAEAAYEAAENGAKPDAVTPVWRVIDAKTPTLKKLSFDPAFILDRRAKEGLAA
jgi:hypothetical protein